ncbi:MAG: PPOX class F420-dependent oxidoreductase [Chloroflexota bacterium]
MIPEAYLDLLEEPVVVALTTMLPDGQPQSTPVWCLWDGENILINTAVGRKKDTNVRQNPKVNVLAIDPQNPYRYLEVRGVVKEMRPDPEEAIINQLAQRYTGKPTYFGEGGVQPNRGDEQRVTMVIAPIAISSMG